MISVTYSHHFPCSSGILNDGLVSRKRFILDGSFPISINVLIYVIDSCLNGLKASNGRLLMIFGALNRHFPCYTGTFNDCLESSKRLWRDRRLLVAIKVRLYY